MKAPCEDCGNRKICKYLRSMDKLCENLDENCLGLLSIRIICKYKRRIQNETILFPSVWREPHEMPCADMEYWPRRIGTGGTGGFQQYQEATDARTRRNDR